MQRNTYEYPLYNNFNELTMNILILAKEILPHSFLFLSILTNTEQYVVAISSNNENITIKKGLKLPLNKTLCNRIDFAKGIPLKYEDLSKEPNLEEVKDTLMNANVNAYLGIPIILKNGEVFGTLCAVNESATKYDERCIKLIEKITNLFSFYLELERIAYRDYLTGCYNRHFLEKYFNEYIEKAGTIFLLDLDGFKEINDSLGHSMGDIVLKECAIKIESVIQQHNLNGVLFRLGGDEFLVHLVGDFDNQEISKIAQTLVKKLSSWELQVMDFYLSVSIGILTYSNKDKQTLNELIKKADNALYRAKASGKNTYKFF
ncbi:sensor domain-containing diguanylate cyclase [Bacillus sp. B1-b2]|nr:sensor domain-containing diguanylate cyclase [Bacillus sp. B1-b2]